jgi:hypothetical protein
MRFNIKTLFIIGSFFVSEILPFFPSIESNGVVHGFIKIMQKTNPMIKHECKDHPPIESIQTSVNQIEKIFHKDKNLQEIENKKTLFQYSMTNDIDKYTKLSLNLRVFKK